ncbi:Hypothetical predicted protein [Cloeon dipterum]|uniref:Uncharacterized protein n=1 Tax=Cloeon dipterum TaxID=197152 RepID=A0A8S1DJB6_9INSE|nr:Hypothetical predicted protein [Cloeon dipterum]
MFLFLLFYSQISNVYFNLIAEKINEIKVAKELIRQEIVQTNGSLKHIEVSISTFAKCARHSRIAECASPECTRHHQLTAGFADELKFAHQLFCQNIERIQLKFDRLMRQEGANLKLNENDLKFLFNVQQQRFYLQLDQNATLAQEIDNLTQSAIDETTFEPQPSTSRGTGRFYRSRQAAQQQQAVDQQLQSLFEEIERVQRQYSESMSRTISAFQLNSQGY